jgi:hypothetical protein
MPVDVTLIVSLLGPDADRRDQFNRAMARRGWWLRDKSADSYRVAFDAVENDEQVVQVCEQDVKQSAYVAGVSRYQATCLISADEPRPESGCNRSDYDECADC